MGNQSSAPRSTARWADGAAFAAPPTPLAPPDATTLLETKLRTQIDNATKQIAALTTQMEQARTSYQTAARANDRDAMTRTRAFIMQLRTQKQMHEAAVTRDQTILHNTTTSTLAYGHAQNTVHVAALLEQSQASRGPVSELVEKVEDATDTFVTHDADIKELVSAIGKGAFPMMYGTMHEEQNAELDEFLSDPSGNLDLDVDVGTGAGAGVGVGTAVGIGAEEVNTTSTTEYEHLFPVAPTRTTPEVHEVNGGAPRAMVPSRGAGAVVHSLSVPGPPQTATPGPLYSGLF